VGRVQRAQQSYWFCTPAGLAEAAASGLLPAFNGSAGGRTTGKKAASAKMGLREHGLALVDVADIAGEPRAVASALQNLYGI
jgi:hypothetical protein